MGRTTTFFRRDGSSFTVTSQYYCAPTAAERMERFFDAASLLSWARRTMRDEEQRAWFELNYLQMRHAYTKPFEPYPGTT